MTADIISPRTNYRHLYNFLAVLDGDEITKLRSIVIGTKDVSAFSEGEIQDLETKLRERKESEKRPRPRSW